MVWKSWAANAKFHISEAKKVIDGFAANAKKKCFNLGTCTHLVTLYRYGKKAANKAPSLLQHQKDGAPFESRVSVDTPAPGVLDVYERQNINDLDTQKMCFKKIMESIQDENIQIIGIYGIGGVTVSQNVDVKRIKEEFHVAAKRIKNGEKILVILDDVWGELKLDEVGIPYGDDYKNCKILLTSRSKDVCETMKATCLISVDSAKKRSMDSFQTCGWDTVETDENLKIIAEKIVEGCGGLPVIKV